MSFEEYQDLQGTGFQGGGSEVKAPEEEMFHSVYIAGKTRMNHINVEEKIEHFQVRGVEYNLSEVNMIITHTKDILAKEIQEQGASKTKCFSYKNTNPWTGTTQGENGQLRVCPLTSAERTAVEFCKECRAQILVAGVYCDNTGMPVLTEEKKPIFVFIRGKGMKYSGVSEYLNDRFNEELPSVLEKDPAKVTEQLRQFEKEVVNNKRFVTRITKATAASNYGDKIVFKLEKTTQLDDAAVLKILKLSKATVKHFNEKFDWSKKATPTGYGSTEPGILSTETEKKQEPDSTGPTTSSAEENQTPPEEKKPEKVFSFDDIDFG